MSLVGATILVLLVTAILCFYKWATRNLNYWQQRKVPHLKSLPVVGNYGSILLGKINIAEKYREFYRQIDGVDYIGILIGTYPALIMKDPELIMRILVKDFKYFHDRGFHNSEKDLLGNNLFFMRNPKWKLLRNKTVSVFSTAKMKAYFEIMDKSTDDLIDYLNETIPDEKVTPARQLMGSAMTDIMSKVMCGVQIHSIRKPNKKHVDIQSSVFAPSLRAQVRNVINFFSPYLAKKVHHFPASTESYYNDLIWNAIRLRKTDNTRRNDLLQIMADLFEEENKLPEEDRVIAEEDVVANIFIMIQAGYETSTSTTSLLLNELAYDRPLQDRVRKEIRTVHAQNGKFNFDSLNSLKYLDQCISETLRLYPLVNNIPRECMEDYKIPGTDLTIERGVYVHLPTLALHTDPIYWKNPDTFDPDRFSEQNLSSIIPGTYLPFGDGPRICIGKRFGLIQLKLLLAKTLYHYEVSPSHKSKRRYPMALNSQLSHPDGDFWLTFTKLTQ